jgi:hypothetical protein
MRHRGDLLFGASLNSHARGLGLATHLFVSGDRMQAAGSSLSSGTGEQRLVLPPSVLAHPSRAWLRVSRGRGSRLDERSTPPWKENGAHARLGLANGEVIYNTLFFSREHCGEQKKSQFHPSGNAGR